MQKKFLLLLVLILSYSSPSLAHEQTFPCGIYLGVGGGYNSTKTNVDIVGQEDAAAPFVMPGGKQTLSAFSLTALLGYLHVFKKYPFTLGGEFFWSSHKGDKEFKRTVEEPNALNGAVFTLTTKTRERYEYGFKVLMGYLIGTCNHLYGVIGVSERRFREDNELSVLDAAVPANTRNTVTKDFGKTYFLLGLGFERGSGCLRYGLEWFYRIGTKTISLANELTNGAANVDRTSTSRKLDGSHSVLFKVTYNFNPFS